MLTLWFLAFGAVLAPAPLRPPARMPGLAAQHRTASRPAAPYDERALQQQVMLDRAGFSPGAIDGHGGPNTDRALAVFQSQRRPAVPPVDTLSRYHITPADAAGPFVDVPEDMMEKS